ncbi:biotin/lipoyl-containing protein [Actinomycetota bacterium]
MNLKVTVNGQVFDVEVEVEDDAPKLGSIFMSGGNFAGAAAPAAPAAAPVMTGNGVKAPLSGSVSKVLVEKGQSVQAGETLVVLEAMKMETEITAPADGVVSEVAVKVGDTVTGGQVLVGFEE